MMEVVVGVCRAEAHNAEHREHSHDLSPEKPMGQVDVPTSRGILRFLGSEAGQCQASISAIDARSFQAHEKHVLDSIAVSCAS